MAGVCRRNPNLDDFIGLNWRCWVDRVNVLSSDAGGPNPEDSKHGVHHPQTMTLRKEDMHIYGHCPANDDFYLVVCSHCDQVVKPQAFETHCEKWHRPVMKCGQTSAVAPQQQQQQQQQQHQPSPVRLLSRASLCKARQKDNKCRKNGGQLTAERVLHPNKSPKTNKEAVSVSSGKALEEKPPLPPPSSSSSTPHPRAPPWHSAPQPPGDRPPSAPLSEKPSVQKSTSGHPAEPPCPQRGARTSTRMHRSIHKNECELNKHKVLDPEKKKVCSREVIIDMDSYVQPQKPPGTSADQQPVEQTTEAGRDLKQLPLKSKPNEKQVDVVEEKKATQVNNYSFNSNCHILRSKNPSENVPPDKGNSSVEVGVQPPYPFNHNLLSGDNSEEEELEEDAELPATPWHPKPLGLCTFGCRTLGCSIFTFDRRLHHLRFALTAMLEHHANAHLWKKMPKVSSSLRSQHVPPPVRTGNRSSNATGSLCLQSTSLEHLETKSSQHDSECTQSSYSTISASVCTFKQRHVIGRPGKAELTEMKVVKDAAQKHPELLLITSADEDDSNTKKLSNIHPPQAKERAQSGFPLASLCSPLRTEGLPGAVHEQVLNINRGLGKKRKRNIESLHLSSSLSRSSKLKRLSLPSRSSLMSWKGEVVQDVLTWGLEKRSDH